MKKCLGLLLAGLLLAGCEYLYYLYPEGEIGMEVPTSFPQRDIVFQVSAQRGAIAHALGFVNADGSGLTTLEFRAQYIGWPTATYPAWSSDGSTLVFRASPAYFVWGGDLLIIHAGRKILHCPKENSGGEGRVSFLGENKAVTNIYYHPKAGVTTTQLALIDLESCRVIRFYLDEAEEGDLGLEAPSITRDGRWLAFVRWVGDTSSFSYVIVVRDLVSGTETVVGEGRNPSWSPDGQWLAYSWEDGIYVMARDGSQKKRVVAYPRCSMNFWPPAPSWSPDGQWLVYHKRKGKWECGATLGEDEDVTRYSIFKVHVETGKEVKIVDGGLNPYWRGAEP